MNLKIILILLMYSLLLVCRPGTKKDECKSRLKDKESLSPCSGGAFIIPLKSLDKKQTDQQKQDFLNLILVECLLLEEARQKCRDASSYQPTIY